MNEAETPIKTVRPESVEASSSDSIEQRAIQIELVAGTDAVKLRVAELDLAIGKLYDQVSSIELKPITNEVNRVATRLTSQCIDFAEGIRVCGQINGAAQSQLVLLRSIVEANIKLNYLKIKREVALKDFIDDSNSYLPKTDTESKKDYDNRKNLRTSVTKMLRIVDPENTDSIYQLYKKLSSRTHSQLSALEISYKLNKISDLSSIQFTEKDASFLYSNTINLIIQTRSALVTISKETVSE